MIVMSLVASTGFISSKFNYGNLDNVSFENQDTVLLAISGDQVLFDKLDLIILDKWISAYFVYASIVAEFRRVMCKLN